MPKRIEYSKGEKIGNRGCTFIEDLPSTRDKFGRSVRQARFTCGVCGKSFVASVAMVRQSKRYCCDDCTCKTKEYHYGDILATSPDLMYIEDAGSNKFNKRLVRVKNCETNEVFVAILSHILDGHLKYGPESCKKPRIEHSAQSRRKYHPGDIIVNPQGERFLYIKEIDYPYCEFRNMDSEITFEGSIHNVMYGVSDGCPTSRGETVVSLALKELGLEYQTQKTFPNLKSDLGYSLRYDFWIPEYNCLMEYDGGQHFFAVPQWGGEEYLQNTKRRDEIKNQYAKDNGYNLIRIPYTDFKKIDTDYISNLLGLLKRGGINVR